MGKWGNGVYGVPIGDIVCDRISIASATIILCLLD